MPKVKKDRKTKVYRHDPLEVDLDEKCSFKPSQKLLVENKDQFCSDDDFDPVVNPKLSKKIAEIALEQEELDQLECGSVCSSIDLNLNESEINDFKDEDNFVKDGYVFNDYSFEEEKKNFGDFFLKSSDPNLLVTNTYTSSDAQSNEFPHSRTLSDYIIEKIKCDDELKKRTQQIHGKSTEEEEKRKLELQERKQRVEALYKNVGVYLSNFKSGKIPRAFKILPKLSDWEYFLYLTDPLNWTPQTMFYATKIFCSNLYSRQVQRFYNLVLLPAVREDIAVNKKLNYHYYQALKKGLYKPAAWFKGLLIPLLQQQCTLRECVIIGSVLTKISIPVLHSSACIIKICDIKPWTGPISYILTLLINKKYSLPIKVLNSLVNYFVSFNYVEYELPVVWHQTLLVFLQRYKYELSNDERKRLNALMKNKFHPKVTAECRKEMYIGTVFVANAMKQ